MSVAQTIGAEVMKQLQQNAAFFENRAMDFVQINVTMHKDGGRVRKIQIQPRIELEPMIIKSG